MSKAIAVLGMHRSGTSCLTGLLEDAGIFLGEVSKKNPYNLKGNQEKLSVMQLHDEVLTSNGGSWDQPPQTKPLHWTEEQTQRLKDIVADYQDIPCWAFKDPRSLFTIEKWRELVPHLQFIGTVRHPRSVAQSLFNRGKLPIEDGVEIWRKYNQRLLEVWQAEKFPIVNFDLPAHDYLQTVKNALEVLGFDQNDKNFEFFEETLRKADAVTDHESLPANVIELHDALLAATREYA